MADNSLGRAWLIRFAGCDAGYVIVTFGYDLEFGGRQATLTDLYIVEKYRRMGLGKSALGLVAITCRTMGITTLELQVERHNRAAQAFYRKLGFEEHDRIPMSKSLT
ncbi:MAG: GNAT family N-acetyltransferase [Acidobacteria bacterium]|nr:GNAT family N-acetyltransferase [Acidobacteriota bacterium]